MQNYRVKFRVNYSNSERTLSLCGGGESEAKEKLVAQGTVSRENRDKIIILSVEKA